MKGSKKDTNKVEYSVEVTRAKEFDSGAVAFNMVVNGITISDCWYREYTNKDGKEGTMISFPSYQGKDKKYYNHCWFPISNELKEDIIAQLQELV